MLSVAAAVAVAAGLAAFLVLFDFDAYRIRRNLASVQELLSKNVAEAELPALGRAKDIADRFAIQPMLDFPPYVQAVSSRQELAGLIYQFRGMTDAIRVEIYDAAITQRPDSETAIMDLTAKGTAQRGNLVESDVRELRLTWKKTTSGWLIAEVRSVSAIRRPEPMLEMQ